MTGSNIAVRHFVGALDVEQCAYGQEALDTNRLFVAVYNGRRRGVLWNILSAGHKFSCTLIRVGLG